MSGRDFVILTFEGEAPILGCRQIMAQLSADFSTASKKLHEMDLNAFLPPLP